MPCGGRDVRRRGKTAMCKWSQISTSKGCLEIPEAGRPKKRSLEASEGMWPCWHHTFGLLASRSVWEHISIVESSPVYDVYYDNPGKLVECEWAKEDGEAPGMGNKQAWDMEVKERMALVPCKGEGGGRQWLGALPPGSKGHLLLCVTPTKRLHSKELRPTPRRRSSTRSMKMLPGKINKN